MKLRHRLRDIYILILYTLRIVANYEKREEKKGPLVRIVIFHSVLDGPWFERVITMLDQKFNLVTPDEFHRGAFIQGKINILLTFDDGYLSWVRNCVPVLKKFNAKGLFFVNSGLLDIARDTPRAREYIENNLRIRPKRPLSWDSAPVLVAEGHTIGGHTVNHYDLAKLSHDELVNEIALDKKMIEEKLGVTLRDFAYPFGRKSNYSKEVTDVVHQYYDHVYTAEPGFAQTGIRENIPRMCILKRQPIKDIERWVHGGFDIYTCTKNIFL